MKISDILKDKKKSQEPANIKTTYPNNVNKNKTIKFAQQDVFDQNSFDFILSGGPKHTDLLMANAFLKSQKSQGVPLPLHCTWYSAALGGEVKQIEGVSGAFYQPSVDDIGSRICVHAIPASDVMEYQGMPAFAETGTLQMDPVIQQKIQNIIQNNQTFHEIEFEVQNMSDFGRERLKLIQEENSIKTSLPLKCAGRISKIGLLSILIINEEAKIEIFPNVQVQEDSPRIDIKKHTHSKFTLNLGQEIKLQCNAATAGDRDVFTLLLRYYCGMLLQKRAEEIIGQAVKQDAKQGLNQDLREPQQAEVDLQDVQQSTENKLTPEKSKIKDSCNSSPKSQNQDSKDSDETFAKPKSDLGSMIKIQKLCREVSRIAKQKEMIKENLLQITNQHELLKTKMQQCLINLNEKTLKIQNLCHQKTQLEQTVSYAQSQLIFLQKQKSEKQSKIQQLKSELDQNRNRFLLSTKGKNNKTIKLKINSAVKFVQQIKSQFKNSMKLAKQFERQKMLQHDFNITAYNASKDKSEEIIKLRDQFSTLSEDYKLIVVQKQSIQVERNHLKKKNESLALQNQKVNQLVKGNQPLSLRLHEQARSQASSQYNIVNAIHVPQHMNLSDQDDYQFEARSAQDEELDKANKKIQELQKVVESYKRVLDQQITKSHSFKKLADDRATKNPSVQKNQELQKLVNSLTVTITDKQLELQAQKHINKQLVAKLHLLNQMESH